MGTRGRTTNDQGPTPDRVHPFILALDIGSSSARALLYDVQGRALPGSNVHASYEMQDLAAGAATYDPDALLACVWRCIDRVIALAGPMGAQIAAVAVDTLASTFLALDAAGRPLTPLITYADTRNAADADQLRADLDERAVHDRTGCLVRTSYWPARLAWLRRTHPEAWRRAAHWATLGEYLELQLFGRSRVSYSAAAWTGLLDRRRLTWDAPLLDRLAIDGAQLGSLVDLDAPLAGLQTPYAARWPVLRNVPWFPAIGDGAAANIGSGCTDARRIALTIGTTGALRVVQRDIAQVPAGLWCYRIDRHNSLLGGATTEGGSVYAWMREQLRLGAPEAVEAALAACPPAGHGLTVLPFLAGERSPDWAGNVQATIHGLTLATTPIDILRAGLEAVAYRFAVIYERLGAARQAQQIIASGSGLLNSPTWMQIFADVLGQPIATSAETEATSRGTALLALRSLGLVQTLHDLPAATGAIYEPDGSRHNIYREAILRQQWLYERVIGPREA